MPLLACPRCRHDASLLMTDARRAYFQCDECDLTFADPSSLLAPAAEKRVYDQHENDPADAEYRRFLNQLAAPLLLRLVEGMQGLDYGCGPGPTLSVMLEEAGMEMQVYDPYFAPGTSVLDREYDFVTCSEVAEHFYEPAIDWERMVTLLRPRGWLGVMTQLTDGCRQFDRWYYKNDPTHVSFYNSNTLAWLAARYGLTIEYQGDRVVLFRKK